MRFRSKLFYGVAILAALFVVMLVVSAASTTGDESNLCANLLTPAESADCETGVDSIQVTIVLCLGLPFVLLFALLGWRNAAGIKSEDRHAELLARAPEA